MKNDISAEIVTTKNILKKIENLNSNPSLVEKDRMYNALIDLDISVQIMMQKTEEHWRINELDR